MSHRFLCCALLLAALPLSAQNVVYYDDLSPSSGPANAFPFGKQGCRVQQLIPQGVIGGPAALLDLYVNPAIDSNPAFNVSQVFYADLEVRMGVTQVNTLGVDWDLNSPNPTTVFRGPLLVRYERDQWVPLGLPMSYVWVPVTPQDNLVIDIIVWDVADTGIVPPDSSGFFLDTHVSAFQSISRAFHGNWTQVQPADAFGADLNGFKIGILRNDGNFVAHDGTCAGSNAQTPRIGAVPGSYPQPMQPFDVLLTQGPANSFAVPVLGVEDVNYLGAPLPFYLNPLGAFGCSMWHSWEVFLPIALTDGAGASSITLTFPVSSFNGERIYATWLCFDPAANAFGFVPSGYASMAL